MQVTLPSGDPVWVSVGPADGEDSNGQGGGAQDVGFRDKAETVLQAAQLPGFAEAVRGVVTSVRQALDGCRPDDVTVDFGIQITARTGGALAVLAEAGGSAQLRVSVSWRRDTSALSSSASDAGEPE